MAASIGMSVSFCVCDELGWLALAENMGESLSGSDVTRILESIGEDGRPASPELLSEVYDELRALASGYLKNERASHTLQATALVHEAYLKLAGGKPKQWENRNHFFRVAAAVMRHILVDHARNKGRLKRGGERKKLPLDEAIVAFEERATDLVALDAALEELSRLDKRPGHVVELRFFGGLSVEDTAQVLGVSDRTVKSDWATAKAWLLRAMDK